MARDDLVKTGLELFAAGDLAGAAQAWLQARREGRVTRQVDTYIRHLKTLDPTLVAQIEADLPPPAAVPEPRQRPLTHEPVAVPRRPASAALPTPDVSSALEGAPASAALPAPEGAPASWSPPAHGGPPPPEGIPSPALVVPAPGREGAPPPRRPPSRSRPGAYGDPTPPVARSTAGEPAPALEVIPGSLPRGSVVVRPTTATSPAQRAQIRPTDPVVELADDVLTPLPDYSSAGAGEAMKPPRDVLPGAIPFAPPRAVQEPATPAAVPGVAERNDRPDGGEGSAGESDDGWGGGADPDALNVEPEGAGLALVEHAPKPRPRTKTAEEAAGDSLATLEGRLRERCELDDFTGALEIADVILERDPANELARDTRELCSGKLLAMYESKIGDKGAIPRLLLEADELIWLDLDHRSGFVLAQIDGASSYEEIVAVAGMDFLESYRIIAKLVQDGVIGSS